MLSPIGSKFRLTTAAFVTALALLGCSETESNDPTSNPGTSTNDTHTPEQPAGSDPFADTTTKTAPTDVGKLSQMLSAATPGERVDAITQILAKGGIKTGDIDQVYTDAVGPSAHGYISAFDVAKIARSFDGPDIPGDIAFTYLADFLADAGWYAIKSDFTATDLLAALKEWIKIARKAPDEPLNANVLIIDEIEFRRTPSVDLAADDTDVNTLVFSALEVELFIAAFERITTEVIPPVQKPQLVSTVTNEKVTARCKTSSQPIRKVLGQAIPTPCSDLKTQFGKNVENIAGAYYDFIGPEALGAVLEKIGVSTGTAKNVGKAIDVLKILKTAQRLAMVYKSAYIRLKPEEGGHTAHKPVEGKRLTKAIVADAGIDPTAWNEYKKSLEDAGTSGKINAAVQNCLKETGFPSLNNLDDIAGVVQNGMVDWEIVRGSNCGGGRIQSLGGINCHVYISQDMNKFVGENTKYQTKLEKTGEITAKSRLVLDLTTEPAPSHPNGRLKYAKVLVRGELLTAEPPQLSTFTSPVTGITGAATSIAELMAGFIQTVSPPQAFQGLAISYHEYDGWSGTMTVTINGGVSETVINPDDTGHTFDASFSQTLTYEVDTSRPAVENDPTAIPGFENINFPPGFDPSTFPVTYQIPFKYSGEVKEKYRYGSVVDMRDICTNEGDIATTVYGHTLYDAFSSNPPDPNDKDTSGTNVFSVNYNKSDKSYTLNSMRDFMQQLEIAGNYEFHAKYVPSGITEEDNGHVGHTQHIENQIVWEPTIAENFVTTTDPFTIEGNYTEKRSYTVSPIKKQVVDGKDYGVPSSYVPSQSVPVTISIHWKLTKPRAK